MAKRMLGRTPGPIGMSPISMTLGMRRSLGLVPMVWAAPSTSVAPMKAASLIKLDMIWPANDGDTKEVKDVQWDLYPKKHPHWKDPQQSEALMGCALASILSALANTPMGDKHIMGMIREVLSVPGYTPVCEVNIEHKNVKASIESYPGPTIKANRYFNVTVGGKPYKVSSVFYKDDSDGEVFMIYMRSPNNALWPCVIEKAYAKYLNKSGYAAFEQLADPAIIWKDIVGTNPIRLHLSQAKKDADILKVVKNAVRTPTIAVSSKLIHGWAVRGYDNGKIKLYDTAVKKESGWTLKNFKDDFSDIYYGNR